MGIEAAYFICNGCHKKVCSIGYLYDQIDPESIISAQIILADHFKECGPSHMVPVSDSHHLDIALDAGIVTLALTPLSKHTN